MSKKQHALAAMMGFAFLCCASLFAEAARFTMAPPGQLDVNDGQTVTLYIQNDASLGMTPPNGYGLELVGLTLPSNVTLLSAMPTTAAPQTSIQVRYSGYGAQNISYDIREIPYRDEYYALWTGVDSHYNLLTAGSTDSNWSASNPIRISDGFPATLAVSASGDALVIDTSNCSSIPSWSPSEGMALTSPGSPAAATAKCYHTQSGSSLLHWEHVPTNITFTRVGGINITTTPELFNWGYSGSADDTLSVYFNGNLVVPGPSMRQALHMGANSLTVVVGDTGMSRSFFLIAPTLTDEGDSVAAPNDLCPDTPSGYDTIDTSTTHNGCGIYLSNSKPQLSFKLNGPAAPVPVDALPMLALLGGLLLAAAGLFRRFSLSSPKAQ